MAQLPASALTKPPQHCTHRTRHGSAHRPMTQQLQPDFRVPLAASLDILVAAQAMLTAEGKAKIMPYHDKGAVTTGYRPSAQYE